MLKGGSSTLQAVLRPPSSPSEHSSSVVKMSICVLGRPVNLFLVYLGGFTEDTQMGGVNVSPLPHSGHGVCAQLSDQVPHQLHPWNTSVGPGAAVRLPPALRLLHSSDLEAASDLQQGLLHGGHQPKRLTSPRVRHLNGANVLFSPPPSTFTGSSPAFSAHRERICQHLPDVSAEWRHLDPFLCVDGCW